jgi:NitT/TauT family transport system permease protein
LQTAADAGNLPAVASGVVTLVVIIVLLDQLAWRPLIAWSNRFKVEMVEGDEPPTSWFLGVLSRSWIVKQLRRRTWRAFSEWMERRGPERRDAVVPPLDAAAAPARPTWPVLLLATCVVLAVGYGGSRALGMIATLPAAAWARLGIGLAATFSRVVVSLAIALVWTVPVGVAIGTSRRMATLLQPVVQVVASIPATALFPILLLALLKAPGGLNVAAILLMLMGTQWYLLFNVIAGAAAIPQDLSYTTAMLGLSRWQRWRTFLLPALFPYIVTGAITAGGGAWNASIVAERVEFGGGSHETTGIGALIAHATGEGDYALLLAGTLLLVVTVVAINRVFWLRLYRLAEERFRME